MLQSSHDDDFGLVGEEKNLCRNPSSLTTLDTAREQIEMTIEAGRLQSVCWTDSQLTMSYHASQINFFSSSSLEWSLSSAMGMMKLEVECCA